MKTKSLEFWARTTCRPWKPWACNTSALEGGRKSWDKREASERPRGVEKWLRTNSGGWEVDLAWF